ncbi:unnamed protein product [Cyprideis torosa]|uniref:Anoctamin transmembrane domain-containing protein n=1 Tax=Cyprideis torosa TaxID=163714 RepID=A0A7R8W4M9_9CRUS|nr:unnamed protein product [Cyprideis torosa]CAG0882038.1 unnamed protein product [Cyprideis torosa]
MPPPVFLQSLIQTYRKHKPGAPSSVKSEVEAVASVGQAGWDRGDSLPEGVPLPPLVPASRHHKPWEGLYTSRSSSHLEGVQAYPPANTKRFQSQNGIRHNIRDTGAPANDDPSCPSSQESRNLVPVFLDDYSAREQAEFRAPQPFPVAQTIHELNSATPSNPIIYASRAFTISKEVQQQQQSDFCVLPNECTTSKGGVPVGTPEKSKRNLEQRCNDLQLTTSETEPPTTTTSDFCEDCSSGYQEDNARSSISSFSQSNKEDNESVRIDQGAPTVIIDDFHSRRHHAPPPPPSKQLMSPAVSARATRRSSSLRLFKEFLQMKFGGHTSDKRDATPSTNEDDMNRSHARLESHERREDGDVPNSSRKKQKRNRNNLNQQFGEVGLRTWTDTGTQTEVAESNTQSDNRKITICGYDLFFKLLFKGSDLIQVKRRVVKHLTLDQQSRNMSSINPDFKIERITVEVVENEKPNAKHRADEKRDPFELKRRYSTKSSLTDTNKRRAVVERSKVAKEFRDEGHFDQTKGFGGTSRKKANVKIKQRGDTSISSIIGTDSSASKYWGDRTPMLEDTDDVEEEEDYLTPGGSGNPEDDSKGKKARLQPQAQDQRNAQQSRTKSVEYQRLQQPDEHQHISKKSVAPNLIDFFSGSEQRHSAGTSTAPSNIQCSHPHAPRRDLFLSPTNLERPGPNSEKRDDDECFLLTLTRGEQENEYFNWISEKRRGMPRRYVDSFCCEARKSCQMACHNYYEVVPEPTEQDTTGGLRVLYPRKTPEMQLRSVRSQTDDSRMQEDNFSIQPMGPLRCTVVPDAMEKAEQLPAATLKWVETQLKKSGLTLESQGDERFYYFLLKLRSDSLGERMPSLINQEMNRKLYKIRVDSDTNVPGLGIRLETKDSIFQFLACEGYLKATFMVGGNCDDANKLLHLDNSVLDASFFLALIWFLIPMEKCLLQGGPTQYFLSWFREIGPNNWQDNLNCAVHSIKHCAFDPKAGVCSITQLLGIFLPSLLRFVFIHFVGLPLGLALSLTLTNLEKHTTEYSWSYSRVAKLCLFVGIINFGIPVYFAFILKPEDHVAVAAFTYSFLTLLILLDGVRILLSYLHEPSQAKAAVSLQSKVSQEGRKEHWDEDRFMLDIWIRTGHALLFFLSAPLAPFIALLGFLVKDSWDRRKLLLHSLQPIAQQGLGLAKSWMIAFYVLGFFCLLSNSHIAWSQISRVASEWGTFQLLLIVIVVTTLLMAAYGFSILVT